MKASLHSAANIDEEGLKPSGWKPLARKSIGDNEHLARQVPEEWQNRATTNDGNG
ncbi:hypothetical protein KJS94_15660 [Flavihumibacter rivuli]|uniref:hypothetical protein n=1 Tax=Flavihumibacter rivuli TaxID=2838156 RepID=UPI001BDDE5D6|nr:hypothetical protein [Flavihumibacter rivuli]ULQ56084.1 hypothetical protein KJS94_15660 [Flavihumibacter rivuli]